MRNLESDSDWSSLVDHLRRETPLSALNSVEAHDVFRRLRQLGYVIQKPAVHPSGLQTTEEAITRVTDKLHIATNTRRRIK